MSIEIRGAREHNLQNIDVEIVGKLTVVTGVSGSGKSSLAFDTLYHEARRRFMEAYAAGSVADRLAPARVREIGGLRPAVAVGQDLLNRNPNSTVASASGLNPLLRLLYARFGQRVCAVCGSELEALDRQSIGARLISLSAAGRISVLAPLVQGVRGRHRALLNFLVDAFGSSAVTVDKKPLPPPATGAPAIPILDPELEHTIEVTMGQFATQLKELEARRLVENAMAMGAWGLRIKGESRSWLYALASVCAVCGTPFHKLEPVDFSRACPHCRGQGCSHCDQSGLTPEASTVRWAGKTLAELLSLSVLEFQQVMVVNAPASASTRLTDEIMKRLAALRQMGLGYLGLERPMPTLSRGEGQRLRLAVALVTQLEDMLYVLDEPTIGQHPADVDRLLPAIRDLKGQVVIVEHDRQAAAVADQVVDLGPGAGSGGGHLVYSGSPHGLWAADTATGRYFSRRDRVERPTPRSSATRFLTLQGVYLRNLKNLDIRIPISRLSVVSGVSGSGKSTLVDDVLVASLQSGSPRGCQAITGPKMKPMIVDQKPIGKNPRSNPATYTGLADIVRDRFAALSSLPASYFSFNRPEGACPDCNGMGAIEVRMRYLPSAWVACASCEGRRFSDEVLAVKIKLDGKQFSIADIYQCSVAETLALIESGSGWPKKQQKRASRILGALIDVGLGYLTLGQPSPSLSGGEAQRLKLARVLDKQSLADRLLVLDEPTTGLHPEDTARLLLVLDRLVRLGATIVVVEHNLDVIRAADWIIDLGPDAGPSGGQLIYAGPLSGFESHQSSSTAEALRSQAALRPRADAGQTQVSASEVIRIRNARAHNLKSVSVDIPKKALTVITGVSGAGKSSLVTDVLENEAKRRFLETLSMYERQSSRDGPEADADLVSGIGVVVSLEPDRRLFGRRATIGTATEISHYLAILLAWSGQRTCLVCQRTMTAVQTTGTGMLWECDRCHSNAEADARHFSPWHYAAACLTCNGVGTLQVPNPGKLIIHPELPLCKGAMYSPGFFPKGYLCKPLNGGYDMVQAFARRYDFDPFTTPWKEMTADAREAFLYGDPEPMEVHFRTRSQSYVRRQAFPGFYGFIRDWDVGGTYTDTEPCPACKGARLRPEYLATRLGGRNFHELGQMDLVSLARLVEQIPETGNAVDHREGVAQPYELLGTSRQIIGRRLRFLVQVGLGYLTLNRLTATLSAGEAQRIKMAGLLGGELSGLTILLDEPTRGLHPSEVHALLDAMRGLRDQGNCVIVVEHDMSVVRAADQLIELGPGSGVKGGVIVAQGTPAEVASSQTATGRWLRHEQSLVRARVQARPSQWLTIHGARENNLSIESVAFPRRRLVGVCGVSGSGKSTLIVDTLSRALAPRKHTTSVASEPLQPGRHDKITGAPARTVVVDQARAGVTSPASYLALDLPLRRIFAETESAQELGLRLSDFNRNCPACKGRGLTKVDLGFLPPLRSRCQLCNGTGYGKALSEIRLAGLTLPEMSELTIGEMLALSVEVEQFALPSISRALTSAAAVGLDYLVLRQPGHTLSGGEAQRLKIARELCRKPSQETLYLLDEPSLGQHMEDLQRLIDVLDRLVQAGNSVIVVEHEVHILAACDWLTELGPGGGEMGGKIIFSGVPENLSRGQTPMAFHLRSLVSETQG